MQRITSAQNPKYKDALQLHSTRGRKKQNRIIVFGKREIDRAIATGVTPDQIFVPEGTVINGVEEKVLYQLPVPLFEKLNYGNRSDQAIMTAMRPSTKLSVLENLPLASDGFITVVEAIEKPGNLGGILRSADGSGTQAVVVADPLTDVFHPNSIRNSSGASFSVPTAVGSTADVIATLKSRNIRILVASLDAKKNFYDVELTGQTAIVFGNEANGVSSRWSDIADESFRIPMLGVADSLNVSVSAAIVMYEALKQRS